MKWHHFKFGKLVRSKVLNATVQSGARVYISELDTTQYIQELKRKMHEEVDEVLDAKTKEEKIEELADVLEVFHALVSHTGVNLEDIEVKRKAKREERGGFENATYIASVEYPEGHDCVEYCLASPEKYPVLTSLK